MPGTTITENNLSYSLLPLEAASDKSSNAAPASSQPSDTPDSFERARPADVFTAQFAAKGDPKSVRATIQAIVPNSQDLTDEVLYAALNTTLNQLPPAQRARFFQSAFAATAAPTLSGEAKAGLNFSDFISRVFSIQQGGLVGPAHIKPAHKDGVSGTVTVTGEGDLPAALTNLQHAVVRIGPGGAGGAPGLAVAFLGEESNESRVFISLTGDSYKKTLSTDAVGITTAGPEGALTFFPSPALQELTLKREGKASNDWMQEAAQFPRGTVLGTLKPDGQADWSIELTTAGPLTNNVFGEQHLRFKRNLGFSTWYTGLAWVVGLLATSFITVPLAIAYGIYRLIRGAVGSSGSQAPAPKAD